MFQQNVDTSYTSNGSSSVSQIVSTTNTCLHFRKQKFIYFLFSSGNAVVAVKIGDVA